MYLYNLQRYGMQKDTDQMQWNYCFWRVSVAIWINKKKEKRSVLVQINYIHYNTAFKDGSENPSHSSTIKTRIHRKKQTDMQIKHCMLFKDVQTEKYAGMFENRHIHIKAITQRTACVKEARGSRDITGCSHTAKKKKTACSLWLGKKM